MSPITLLLSTPNRHTFRITLANRNKTLGSLESYIGTPDLETRFSIGSIKPKIVVFRCRDPTWVGTNFTEGLFRVPTILLNDKVGVGYTRDWRERISRIPFPNVVRVRVPGLLVRDRCPLCPGSPSCPRGTLLPRTLR